MRPPSETACGEHLTRGSLSSCNPAILQFCNDKGERQRGSPLETTTATPNSRTASTATTATTVFTEHGASLVDEVFGAEGPHHLVLLHGWGLNRDSLRGIGILFEKRFRVHLIDLPGFGDAAPPPADWDTTAYARLVEHYLAERTRGAVVLMGHSFGGRVAVRVAASRPSWLQAVALLAVPGLPASRWSRPRMRRAAIRMLRRLLVGLAPLTGPGPVSWHTSRFGSKDYLAAGEALRPILVRTVNEDLTESARHSACPFLLVYGQDDTETPAWLGERYRALLGERATLHVLPHKDHHLYAGTGAHLTAFLARQWLDRLDACSGADAPARTEPVSAAWPAEGHGER